MIWQNKIWIEGKWVESASKISRLSPFNNEPVAETHQLAFDKMPDVISASVKAFATYRKSSRYLRSRLLTQMAQGIAQRREEICQRLVKEAGKPWMLSDVEVNRAIQTFTLAAEEAKRLGGEIVALDQDAAARNFESCQSLWQARGPVLAITPFNFPLNLVAHKVAPALAVGASVILKPAPQAPGAAVILAEIFEKACAEVKDQAEQVPLSAFQVVHCDNETIGQAVKDHRIGCFSFTGSDTVGWRLLQLAERKKVALELGGNAAVIVHKDADLKRASTRSAFGGFAYAGQVCISVQKVMVHEDVYEEFQKLFLDDVRKVKVGDPSSKDTLVGPLIDEGAANRVESWINEAKQNGAKVLLGGERSGNIISPTVLTNVKPEEKVACQEAFGPLVTLQSYKTMEEAVDLVNASRFGLQAGVFTDSVNASQYAAQNLDVGGIIINDVPTFRADNMPYGGFKDSGLGREGVRYAMEEYCERKTIVRFTSKL